MKYARVDFGQTEAAINKLGGMEGLKLFLSGATTVLPVEQVKMYNILTDKLGGMEGIKLLLSGKTVVVKSEPSYVWKTIILGTYKSSDELRKALEEAGNTITGCLSTFFLGTAAFPVSQQKIAIELAVLSVADLGFDSGKTAYKDIRFRGKELGLQDCPVGVAAPLRLDYQDQPKGIVRLAMKPIQDQSNFHYILRLVSDGAVKSLDGSTGHPECKFSPEDEFVFCRRKWQLIA